MTAYNFRELNELWRRMQERLQEGEVVTYREIMEFADLFQEGSARQLEIRKFAARLEKERKNGRISS